MNKVLFKKLLLNNSFILRILKHFLKYEKSFIMLKNYLKCFSKKHVIIIKTLSLKTF